MPESTDRPDGSDADLDAIADELYALPPDEFVPARDDRVTAAKQAGDRDLARALARLRRPTKAAWLANLLARHRAEQLDGLVALARSLAQAQQQLDGDALRALSGQRHRAVAAMARDAGRLAARRGEAVSDALLREVAGILDAALADPAVAEEVRSGRLTKTVRYSGFGPEAGADTGADGDMAAWAASAPQRPVRRPAPERAEPDSSHEDAEQERAERERAERERLAAERKAREQELAAAEAEEAAAREQQESDEAERDRADDRHTAARDRVGELAEALDAARAEEQAALEAVRATAGAARTSAREAAAAAVRTTRARTRLEQLPGP